ncbi:MAG: DEAD/DEAH box helicase [Fuerstiella sp.]
MFEGHVEVPGSRNALSPFDTFEIKASDLAATSEFVTDFVDNPAAANATPEAAPVEPQPAEDPVVKTEVAEAEVAKTEVARTEVAKTEVAKTEAAETMEHGSSEAEVAQTIAESPVEPLSDAVDSLPRDLSGPEKNTDVQKVVEEVVEAVPMAVAAPAAAADQVETVVVAAVPQVDPVENTGRADLRQPVAESALSTPEPAVSKAPVVSEKNIASDQASTDSVDGPKFSDLPLSPEVQRAVQAAGYERPTDIQTQIIPHMLDGRDVLAQSQTGTGKTAAFALPILSGIRTGGRKPQVLVLAPTRELAMQVADSFSRYGSHLPDFDVAAVYGGQGYDVQLRQLRRGVPVVVGTPGRVIDHIKRGTLDLSELKCLVLDEADEMLNMGFLEDVQFVLEQTPPERQIALFSATLPAPIRDIAQAYLNDPVRISIRRKTMTAEAIRQRAVFVAHRDKVDVLSRFLEVEETDGVIVFTKTREATVTVAEQLNTAGFSAVALNGDMPQAIRERTIEQLKKGRLDVLVATDVAARGLDVSRISHVFNFDVPQDSESYIHRIGRTGRAGRKGEAIIFLTKAQRSRLRSIERVTKQPIEVVEPPTADEINKIRIQQFRKQIDDVVASQDLTLFRDILSKHAAESETPMEQIAAALAVLGRQGRPLLAEDRPRRRSDDRNGRGNGESRDRFEHGGQADRGGRGRRSSGPPERGMDRYRIEVGRQDGVKPGNIVGAVANEAGIEGEYIGPISIYDSHSTIDLPEGMPPEIHETLQRVRVAGKQLRISLDRGDRRGGFRSGQFGAGRGKGANNAQPRGARHGGDKRGNAGKFRHGDKRRKHGSKP